MTEMTGRDGRAARIVSNAIEEHDNNGRYGNLARAVAQQTLYPYMAALLDNFTLSVLTGIVEHLMRISDEMRQKYEHDPAASAAIQDFSGELIAALEKRTSPNAW